jgi:hypothetical protein
MNPNGPRTFINHNATLHITPKDWDTIQDVFELYLGRVGKKRREDAEATFRSLWASVGETHSYTPVKAIRKKR